MIVGCALAACVGVAAVTGCGDWEEDGAPSGAFVTLRELDADAQPTTTPAGILVQDFGPSGNGHRAPDSPRHRDARRNRRLLRVLRPRFEWRHFVRRRRSSDSHGGGHHRVAGYRREEWKRVFVRRDRRRPQRQSHVQRLRVPSDARNVVDVGCLARARADAPLGPGCGPLAGCGRRRRSLFGRRGGCRVRCKPRRQCSRRRRWRRERCVGRGVTP